MAAAAARASRRLTRHRVTPALPVPEGIARPPYAGGGAPDNGPVGIVRYDERRLEGIRRAAALAAEVREFAGSMVRPGVTGTEIDDAVHRRIVAYGAWPAPLEYLGFPKSVCVSPNEVVCHGIPDDRALLDGDIVSIDVSVYLDGYFGDCCGTWGVGPSVDAAALALVGAARRTLDDSIAACRAGARFSDIGDAVCDVAEPLGLGVVEDYTGHGIGEYFHAEPLVQHTRGGVRARMEPGNVFTIEPMISEGSAGVRLWKDGWTVVTDDGGWCAQFEETLVVLESGGVDVITEYTPGRFADYFPRPLPA